MTAAGMYIQTLREHKGLSRAKMAEAIGTTDNTLWRIESGRQEPSAGMLVAIVRAIGGSLEQFGDLLTQDVSEAVAQQRAAEWISQRTPDQRRTELDRLLELAKELEADPRKYGQLLGYAERLREESQ